MLLWCNGRHAVDYSDSLTKQYLQESLRVGARVCQGQLVVLAG